MTRSSTITWPPSMRAGRDLDVAAEYAVMADVAAGHEVVVVGDARRLLGLSSMHGGELAEDVAVADDESGIFTVGVEPDVPGAPPMIARATGCCPRR